METSDHVATTNSETGSNPVDGHGTTVEDRKEVFEDTPESSHKGTPAPSKDLPFQRKATNSTSQACHQTRSNAELSAVCAMVARRVSVVAHALTDRLDRGLRVNAVVG